MNTTSRISESLREIIDHPAGGVVTLVDDLLASCRDRGLRIEWQKNLLRVRSLEGDMDESLNMSVPASIFRDYARVAVRCNARRPGSVSPYGGTGELSLEPQTAFAVTFVNTSAEQRLELEPTGTQESGKWEYNGTRPSK